MNNNEGLKQGELLIFASGNNGKSKLNEIINGTMDLPYQPNNTFKMPLEMKQKWLEALRSGIYRQTTDTLYKQEHDSFCCLGVLCMVNGASLNDVEGKSYPKNVNRDLYEEFGEFYVPLVMREGKTVMTQLADLNDIYGLSFEQIADIIDATVETY